MESTQNDVISISDLLIVLIKRIKLWLTIFILGSLFSIIYGALHKDNYAYSALIKGPSYLSNGQMQYIISDSNFTALIQLYLHQYKLKNPKAALIDQLTLDSDTLSLKVTAKEKQKQAVDALIDNFVQFVANSADYNMQINNWSKNVKYNISLLEKQNLYYQRNEKNLQDSLKRLTQSNDIGSVNGQALLNNLSQTVIAYQDRVFNNNTNIQRYKSQLQSLNTAPYILETPLRSLKPQGLTSAVIAILGVILSLILATAIIFVIEFISNTKTEVKSKLSK
ncbi:hypothetical protein [Fangia hongkongensis]|nr:hypothetical protein [Fangia hongkongensis]